MRKKFVTLHGLGSLVFFSSHKAKSAPFCLPDPLVNCKKKNLTPSDCPQKEKPDPFFCFRNSYVDYYKKKNLTPFDPLC